jgi:hypothetical protein
MSWSIIIPFGKIKFSDINISPYFHNSSLVMVSIDTQRQLRHNEISDCFGVPPRATAFIYTYLPRIVQDRGGT